MNILKFRDLQYLIIFYKLALKFFNCMTRLLYNEAMHFCGGLKIHYPLNWCNKLGILHAISHIKCLNYDNALGF